MTAVAALIVLATALLAAPVDRSAQHRLRGVLGPRFPTAPAGPPDPLRPGWLVLAALVGAGLGVVVAGVGAGIAVGIGVTVGLAALRLHRRRRIVRPVEESVAAQAGAWELLAVCLRAGLPVATALPAAAAAMDGPIGDRLRHTADLLALGADPAQAWGAAPGGDVTDGAAPSIVAFGRSASRSAGTGAGLAQVAATEAARLRAQLTDRAQAGAQRAGVLITAPLGLCFLPAFVAVGIVPVLIGLVGDAVVAW